MLSAGIEPAGLQVYLGDWRDENTTLVTAMGSFRFDELAPGAHTLTLNERPGVLAAGARAKVELIAGETALVTLDARQHAVCQLRLTIGLGALDPTGRQVDLVAADGSRSRERLGRCDATGLVIGAARGWGKTKTVVHFPGYSSIEHPRTIDLLPAGEIEETLQFDLEA